MATAALDNSNSALDPRLSFSSHANALDAFIANWSDDDDDDNDTSSITSAQQLLTLLTDPHTPRTATRIALNTHRPTDSPRSYSDALTSSASSPSSPDTSYGALTKPKAPSRKAPRTLALKATRRQTTASPRTKRELPKVEIAQLREQAEALETQLLELREYWKCTPSRQCESNAPANARSVVHTPNWQRATASERNALRASEATHNALRTTLDRNRTTMRVLRKLLAKRMKPFMRGHVFDTALYRLPLRDPQHVFAASASIFQTLLRVIEPMFAATARIEQLMSERQMLQQRGDASTDALTDGFRDWRLQNDGACSYRDVALEAVDCFALPFDQQRVAAAIRREHDALGKSTTHRHASEFFERCDASTLRQTVMAYDHPNQRGFIRHQDVTHFYSDASHTVVVSATRIEPVTATGAPIVGIVLQEQKWTVVRKDASENNATSLVRSFRKITCVEIAPMFEGYWTSSHLVHSMAPAWDRTFTKQRNNLEATLLDMSIGAEEVQ